MEGFELAEYARGGLLLGAAACGAAALGAACKRAHLNPQIVFESGQFSSILSMVGTGMGVSIVPEMAIDKRPRCRYVRIADDKATRTVGATILRGRSLTRLHRAFLAHLRPANSVVTHK